MLGQHRIEVLSSQYCPYMSDITLHKEINVGPERADTFSQENNFYNVVWSPCANIAQKTYLCNDGPESTNNFAPKNNLQFCLDLSGQTLHKESACGMLAHG